MLKQDMKNFYLTNSCHYITQRNFSKIKMLLDYMRSLALLKEFWNTSVFQTLAIVRLCKADHIMASWGLDFPVPCSAHVLQFSARTL